MRILLMEDIATKGDLAFTLLQMVTIAPSFWEF